MLHYFIRYLNNTKLKKQFLKATLKHIIMPVLPFGRKKIDKDGTAAPQQENKYY